MKRILSELEHREYMDMVIDAVNIFAPNERYEAIRISRSHVETMLKVLLESGRNDLYQEYFTKFNNLGFNFESLSRDSVSIAV